MTDWANDTQRIAAEHIKRLEFQNKFMRQALTDIYSHEEDESWNYEILQFIAKSALELIDEETE